MAVGMVWTLTLLTAAAFALLTGNGAAVAAAAAEGMSAAVRLTLTMGGGVMFYSAVMEVMDGAGLTASLSRGLRPVLEALFPSSRKDRALSEALSCNVCANLLGLGNAATPAGIRAAVRLRELSGGETASDELCRLVVLNTASVQLLPATVAALRAGLGAANPFDILPAVWLTSACSVAVGLLCERWFARRKG